MMSQKEIEALEIGDILIFEGSGGGKIVVVIVDVLNKRKCSMSVISSDFPAWTAGETKKWELNQLNLWSFFVGSLSTETTVG